MTANSAVSNGTRMIFELIKAFMVTSLPARMKKIQSKMKALECKPDFSHYKSKRILSDAQGQLVYEEMNFISIALSFKFSHNVMYVCMYSLC